jgi:hypothetical protein
LLVVGCVTTAGVFVIPFAVVILLLTPLSSMSTFDAGAIVLFQQLCSVAINVAAWSLWWLMHNSIRRCGDIIDLTRDQIASRLPCRAEHSTSSPKAAVSIQPLFHHIHNKVLISNNQLHRFPLTGSQQIIPVPLLIWHSCLLLLPLRQHDHL